VHEVAEPDERVVAADGAGHRFMRTCRADHGADHSDRVRALQHDGHDGRRADDLDQVVIEELALVHRVVLLGHSAIDPQQAQRGDAQAAALEAGEDLARDAALDGIGLQHDEGALDGLLGAHDAISITTSAPSGARTVAIAARGPTAAT
jgi:hypothetical protein